MANITVFSNINTLSNQQITTIVICSILIALIIACAIVYVVLKIKKTKKLHISPQDQELLSKLEQDNKSGELYKNAILDKEIAKYKKAREQYKEYIVSKIDIDPKQLKDQYEKIIQEELEEFKKDQLVKLNDEILKYKNEILKETILNTMQPLHLKVINESSVSYLPITEEIKPFIVGKKGQNIKHLNEVTNCNMNLDRTSKFLEISCPNPYDRAIAINTVKHLIKSEAFDMLAIENVYKKEKALIDKECVEIGKEYLKKLNIEVPNSKIYNYIGRLKYRWSFSQNVLEHCYETALICEKLAQEFGLDPDVAKRVGFFHDIGKAIDYEKKYDHISSGIKIAKECDLDQMTLDVILKHHRTNCYDDYILLVRTADAWSAARSGARHTPLTDQANTIKLVEEKIKKIQNVLSCKVEVGDNTLRISFLPVINNKPTYLWIKNEIIKSLKKDVRFNKYKLFFIDETLI